MKPMSRQQILDLATGAFWGAALLGLVLLLRESGRVPVALLWVGGVLAVAVLLTPFILGAVRGADPQRPSRGGYLSAGGVLGAVLATVLVFGVFPDQPRPRPASGPARGGLGPAVPAPPGAGSSLDPHGQAGAPSPGELRARLERDPGDVQALLDLSDMYLQIGRSEVAVELLRRGEALHPEDFHLKGHLTGALLADGQAGAALSLAEAVLQREPLDHTALPVAVLAALAEEEVPRARRVLGRAAEADPARAAELVALLDALESAAAEAERNPASREAQIRAGDLFAREGLSLRAAAFYERALVLAPGDPAILGPLARSYRAARQPARAAAPALAGMEEDPTGELAVIAFTSSMETGDLASAERAVSVLRRVSPEQAEAATRALEEARARSGEGGGPDDSP
jgi:tetratricopeptide (TPR) repeat protein